MNDLVLVTGGNGYVGTHTIARLLREGRRVRTTVRAREREQEVLAALESDGVDPSGLEIVVAGLDSDERWAAAMAGCPYVLHVASPFPARQPENEDDVIVPAREGTLRVLRAARRAGVRRVVLTSSFAAVGYSPKPAACTTRTTGPTRPTTTPPTSVPRSSPSAPPGTSWPGRAAPWS